MNEENAKVYWSPLCELVLRLRCWARIVWMEDTSTQEGWWGQLLTMPTEDYLEAAGGPIPIREIQWIDVSTIRLRGGLGERPLEMFSVKDEILAGLEGTDISWELKETTWSRTGLFQDEPVQVVRFMNPFWLNSRM